MTHAANVISGYALTAVAVLAYAAWVVRRGRTLGRSLGIGSAADPVERSRDPAPGDAAGPGHGDLAEGVASAPSPAGQRSGDAAAGP